MMKKDTMDKKDCGVCAQFKQYTALPKRSTKDAYTPFPCQPDSEELGRASWTLLHSMAAYYPESPSAQKQTSMTSFFNSLSLFYPCSYCAGHLGEYLVQHPPAVEDNKALSECKKLA